MLLGEASIFSTQKIGYPGTITPFSPFPLNALRPHIGYQESSEPFCIGRVKQIDLFSFSCHIWCAGWSEEIFLILPSILEGNEKLVKGLLLSWHKILATMLESTIVAVEQYNWQWFSSVMCLPFCSLSHSPIILIFHHCYSAAPSSPFFFPAFWNIGG